MSVQLIAQIWSIQCPPLVSIYMAYRPDIHGNSSLLLSLKTATCISVRVSLSSVLLNKAISIAYQAPPDTPRQEWLRVLFYANHIIGNQGAIEAQAPLAHDSSPEISSATSPQGFYTPVEEGTPAATRPNSYLQAPTPTSAIMTVSLDHYLDPQRISFGSPPNSEFHPRRTSFDDSLSVFSPPPSGATISHHRRQSSLGVGPPWLQNHLARSPRCSFSVSSHHTCTTPFSIIDVMLL